MSQGWSIQDIRRGLGERLETIPGLRVIDYAPGTFTPPAAIVDPSDDFVVFDSTFGDSDVLHFDIHVLVTAAQDRSGQSNLDGYLQGAGNQSVRAAVSAEPTLGGRISYARVVGAAGYGLRDVGGVEYAGVTFAVEVVT